MSAEYWPGTQVKKSTNNAFTSHGYVIGGRKKAEEPQPHKQKAGGQRGERAFGVPNGTMPHLNKT